MTNMPSLKEILTKLISFKSITPNDDGCQAYMISLLKIMGFECQTFNNQQVSNFYAQKGTTGPLIVFAGHTDVVPCGDLNLWLHDPFQLYTKDQFFYGRGIADMKGSLACMIIAVQRFIEENPNYNGSIGFLITSGEEGDDYDLGTPYVMQQLYSQGLKIDYCVVGEPSSTNQVGDTIKIGRRGSLNAQLTLQGKQGHVAYPHLAINPIHKLLPAINELANKVWDHGDEHFPPTSFQITHLVSSGAASNVIPGKIECNFNLRYSTQHTNESLQNFIQNCFIQHDLNPTINWQLSGQPFITTSGKLLTTTINVIKKITTQTPELSTSGGTSDGRFIAPYGVEVIELGPVNKTIHQINECVTIESLDLLTNIYCELLFELIK